MSFCDNLKPNSHGNAMFSSITVRMISFMSGGADVPPDNDYDAGLFNEGLGENLERLAVKKNWSESCYSFSVFSSLN